MSANYIKSSFGMDVSKKVIIDSNNEDLVKAWAKGSVDPSVLKKVSMTYSESFTAKGYAPEVNKAVNEILSGGINLLKRSSSLIRGLSMGGGISEAVSSGSDSSTSGLTSAVLELGTALTMANTVMGKEGSSEELNNLISTAIGTLPRYNVPTRNGIPGVSIDFGDTLKINFAYGSCGLFNAEEEVYNPIKTIMESLNKISANGDTLSLTKTGGIPFSLGNFMAKNAVIGYLTGTGDKLSTTLKSVASSVKGVADLGKSTKKLIELKKSADDFFEKTEQLTDYSKVFKDDYLTSEISEAGGGWLTQAVKGLGSAVTGGDAHFKTPKKDSIAEKALLEGPLIDETSGKYKKLADEYQPNSPWIPKYIKKYDENVDKINAAIDENPVKSDFFDSLNALVSIQPNAVSSIISTAYASAKTNEWSLSLGWVGTNGSTIYYSLDDIISGIKDGSIKKSLSLKGIPQNINFSFDYSNLDENGFPKAGSISIQKLWIMDPVGTFNNTFSHSA